MIYDQLKEILLLLEECLDDLMSLEPENAVERAKIGEASSFLEEALAQVEDAQSVFTN